MTKQMTKFERVDHGVLSADHQFADRPYEIMKVSWGGVANSYVVKTYKEVKSLNEVTPKTSFSTEKFDYLGAARKFAGKVIQHPAPTSKKKEEYKGPAKGGSKSK